MPVSKKRRDRGLRTRLTQRERVALYVRRCDPDGLKQWLTLAAATGQASESDRAHIDRILHQEIEKAPEHIREWWLADRCVCGAPLDHEVDPERLYQLPSGKFLHHDEFVTALRQGGNAIEVRGFND